MNIVKKLSIFIMPLVFVVMLIPQISKAYMRNEGNILVKLYIEGRSEEIATFKIPYKIYIDDIEHLSFELLRNNNDNQVVINGDTIEFSYEPQTYGYESYQYKKDSELEIKIPIHLRGDLYGYDFRLDDYNRNDYIHYEYWTSDASGYIKPIVDTSTLYLTNNNNDITLNIIDSKISTRDNESTRVYEMSSQGCIDNFKPLVLGYKRHTIIFDTKGGSSVAQYTYKETFGGYKNNDSSFIVKPNKGFFEDNSYSKYIRDVGLTRFASSENHQYVLEPFWNYGCITMPAAPTYPSVTLSYDTKGGYSLTSVTKTPQFAGWSNGVASGAVWEGLTSDATVTASWTFPSVKLEPTAKQGYTLQGYDLNGDGKVDKKAGESISLTANINAVAVWSPIKYNIVFDSNGGSTVDNMVVNYDEEVDLPIPVKKATDTTQYVFIGWSDGNASTMSGKVKNLSTGDDVTLKAVWSEKTTTIVVVDSGNGKKSTGKTNNNSTSNSKNSDSKSSSGGNTDNSNNGANVGNAGDYVVMGYSDDALFEGNKIKVSAKNVKKMSIKVSFAKIDGAKYEIRYATNKKFKKAKKIKTKKNVIKLKKLKKGKKYYIKVRAYKKISDGDTIYSKWSKIKKVKIKK